MAFIIKIDMDDIITVCYDSHTSSQTLGGFISRVLYTKVLFV